MQNQKCARCGKEIKVEPVVRNGKVYCCQHCADADQKQ